MKTIKIGIIGALSYSGQEIIRILEQHNFAEILIVTSETNQGILSDYHPSLLKYGNLQLQKYNAEQIASQVDLVFLALPHTVSHDYLPHLLTHNPSIKIIDLSGAFRLKDMQLFNDYYGFDHQHQNLIEKAVYGLCEIYKDNIKNASIIANPGCYPTSVLLPLIPLQQQKVIQDPDIIIDSKSGISGKGKKLSQDSLFCEHNENAYSYKIGRHQHTPEIERFLNENGPESKVIFTPSVIPLNRGILSSIYIKSNSSLIELHTLLEDFYKDSVFVKVLKQDKLPKIADVVFTNQLHCNIFQDQRTGTYIIISVIDNLVKGAAGQAIQNMNLMFGFSEAEALR